MYSGSCPLPIESSLKKALIFEASGLGVSGARFLASGEWPLPMESFLEEPVILEPSGLGGSRARI